ncbi:hypothetical protein NDU88_002579 [Pleurodeles waltl]|uniref:Uncharacterized protein n=1 Tax=Pleurodeles waltl TaxID=8319 RepID=A0AAV7SE43_PLEWA|nr:hypothetical protein NDU88_002579 [Pleurodeles waltl]
MRVCFRRTEQSADLHRALIAGACLQSQKTPTRARAHRLPSADARRILCQGWKGYHAPRSTRCGTMSA